MTPDSRKPDYRVKALNKVTNAKAYDIGGAWKNQDGSITITLNTFVCLQQNGEIVVTLFPNDGSRSKPGNSDTPF